MTLYISKTRKRDTKTGILFEVPSSSIVQRNKMHLQGVCGTDKKKKKIRTIIPFKSIHEDECKTISFAKVYAKMIKDNKRQIFVDRTA